MTGNFRSRRTFLGLLTFSVSSFSLLTACGISKTNIEEAALKLASLLRHQPVAAHLGRLYVESDTSLQSLSRQALITEIANNLGIDIPQILDSKTEVIQQLVDNTIRQDFANEIVVAVDGWLLSQLEARICVVAYRNTQHTNP